MENLPEITSSPRTARLSPSHYALTVAPQHLLGIGDHLLYVCSEDSLGFAQINKEAVALGVP